jgi:hypothetical protein
MRSKETKRTLFNFLPYECAAAEEYLELMAEKGWMLQAINGAFLKFKKAEPQKIKYSVDVFHKVSVFDPKDSDAALEYREYCKAAGWNYVCQKGKIQVFYTEDDKKNISIHTDENEKFKSVFKASLYYVGSEFLLILMVIFNLYMQLFSGSVDYTLVSNLGLLSTAVMFSVIFINSIEVISFFVWVIKARVKLKENKFMPYNNYKQLRIKNKFRNACGLIMLLVLFIFSIFDNQGSTGFIIFLLMVMCIPGIIMIYVKRFINRKRYSKNINRAIIISGTLISICLALMLTGILVGRSINVIEQSKVPAEKANLTLSDFGLKENDDASPYINFDKSILAQRTEYICDNRDNGLIYTIFQSQYSWVIKFDENRLLSSLNKYGIDLKQEDTNLPNNIKVYSDSNKRTFVLVSENRVVDIKKDFSGISDDEFLNKVYKKLF